MPEQERQHTPISSGVQEIQRVDQKTFHSEKFGEDLYKRFNIYLKEYRPFSTDDSFVDTLSQFYNTHL